jgi:hypothetical protein
LEDSAQAHYQALKEQNMPLHPFPQTKVKWCVPLLPGLLLANSSETLGPLIGHGSLKLVFYDGTGTEVICEALLWLA